MDAPIDIREPVKAALATGAPVVALESSLISHGMAPPRNVEIGLALESIVGDEGAVPATIAVIDGRVRVGLTADEIQRIGETDGVAKVSRRDLPVVLAHGGLGGTTVAATMYCAHQAGIAVFATGGIGGVHRGGETTLDISADLEELAQTPVAVVSAGAKSILDLPKTLEYLETRGVPVIGYGTDSFPAFYARDSGLSLVHRTDGPDDAARVLAATWAIGLTGGVVIANPIPEAHALDSVELEAAIEKAEAEAKSQGITGKNVTPYLLERLGEITRGRSLDANAALLENNAMVAARIAVAYAKLDD